MYQLFSRTPFHHSYKVKDLWSLQCPDLSIGLDYLTYLPNIIIVLIQQICQRNHFASS